jgi:aminopeptidase N
MNITVPTGYVAASNGKLVGTTNNGNGTVTWRWQQNQPITTYLMCMTVSRFSISTIPYIKSSGDTIPLQYYAWNAPPFVDSAWTATVLPTVRQMVTAYSNLFGEYPFDKYGMTAIVPFGYLGMEHQTLTTMNRYYATDQRVVSHELSHQWWGDDVTCGTWADIWLNESFATYSEALWREHLGGMDSLKKYMSDTLSGFQWGSWQGAIYDPVGQGFNLFDQVVYTKGGWVLHTLRGVVGDSTFFRILRAYRNKYQGKSAVTAEFEAVVDSVTGTNMNWFFNQWIYGRGWPKYTHAYRWTGDSLTLLVYQLQPESNPTYKMPIQVRAYAGLSSRTFTIWDSLRTQSFRLPYPMKPDSIKLDPDYWILKQLAQLPPGADSIVISNSFRLWQNFPNPFNPTTNIAYSLPSAGFVTLKLFDVLGREVETLFSGSQTIGPHFLTFDGADLPSGVYFCRLQSGSGSQLIKMSLIK